MQLQRCGPVVNSPHLSVPEIYRGIGCMPGRIAIGTSGVVGLPRSVKQMSTEMPMALARSSIVKEDAPAQFLMMIKKGESNEN